MRTLIIYPPCVEDGSAGLDGPFGRGWGFGYGIGEGASTFTGMYCNIYANAGGIEGDGVGIGHHSDGAGDLNGRGYENAVKYEY